MHPREIRALALGDARALLLQMRDAARHVLALEADEIDALAVLREELADGLARIGRLEQLDVPDARRQDGVQEAEFLRLPARVHLEAEEPRVSLDRFVHVLHHHRQLYDVAKHALSSFIAGQRSRRNRRGGSPGHAREHTTWALGQVASQTRRERPGSPRRMWVYVEGCPGAVSYTHLTLP